MKLLIEIENYFEKLLDLYSSSTASSTSPVGNELSNQTDGTIPFY